MGQGRVEMRRDEEKGKSLSWKKEEFRIFAREGTGLKSLQRIKKNRIQKLNKGHVWGKGGEKL